MKVNEQFYGNHQHMDGGSFQIYYKGPLAIDSGSYQGASGGYNSPHNKNYFKRTIAHNSLLIYDPSEKFACWNYGGAGKTEFATNDGGQRMPGDRWDTCRSFENLLSESYTVGKTLGHAFGPDQHTPEYTYLKGDITKAYTAKVEDVRRSFVFLNLEPKGNADLNPEGEMTEIPAVMIVYDHIVSADPSFKKYWLLHSIEEPQTGTQEFTVMRTKDGDTGKLHCSVLLPEANVEKIGGPGKDCWVFGENYPNAATTRPDPCNERGAWRVEVTPKTAAKEDCFLNVIQVAETSCKKMLPVQRIDADKVVGVSVADRVVTFSRDSKALSEEFCFEIPKSAGKSIKVLVTDLAPGKWTVLNGKKVIEQAQVDPESGSIYFNAAPGKYTLTR
jgi:heparin/heparan-sulfate lyase